MDLSSYYLLLSLIACTCTLSTSQAVTCDPLPTATNAYTTSCTTNQIFDTQCFYLCNTGYETSSGDTSVATTCQSTGAWNPSVITCNVVSCSPLTPPTNGNMGCSNSVLYNSECTFTCNMGFEGSGTDSRTCQATKMWSGSNDFTCTVVSCSPLMTPANGNMDCSDGVLYSSVCTFTCDMGFEGSGTDSRTCQATKVWSGSNDFTCTAVSCSSLTTPTNGNMGCSNGVTYNSVCTFTCDMGYEGSGTDSRTCLATKTWSGSNDFTCTACTDNTYGNECSQMCSCITDAQCNHVSGYCTCTTQFQGMVCDTRDLSVTLVQQSTYVVTNASDLALQCNVNLPSQDVQMKWTFHGTDLVNPAVPEDGIVNLIRTNLDPERDSGVYACVATSGQGVNAMTVTTSVTVDIQVPAVITETPVGVNLTLSENAEFRCTCHGKRIPTLTWHSGSTGQLMNIGFKIDITYDPQGYTLSSILRINSLVRSDGGSYSCQVNNGYGVIEEDFNLIVLEVPDPVTITQFKAVTAERIDLSWTVTFDGNLVINNCSVEYMYHPSNASVTQWIFYETVDGGGPMFMVQIEGLTPFTEYKARVKCRNELGYSEFTESSIVKTPITSPDPPTDVTIEAKSESELLVTWEAPKIVHGILQSYKVYYKLQDESDYGEPSETNGTETSLTIDGLEAYTNYQVQVTAINTNQNGSDLLESSYSIMESGRTLEGVPDKVLIVQFVNKSSTELEVRWKPSLIPRGVTNRYELKLLNNVLSQQIRHYNFTNVESPEDELTDYKDNFGGLSAYTEYTVIINVCNRLHCSGDATKSATTSHGQPSPPRQVRLCDGNVPTSPDCNMCWQEPSTLNGDIIYYTLEYTIHKQTAAGFDSTVEGNGEWQASSTSRNYSISKASLLPYSDYQIRVKAATYAEESDPSTDTVSCRTPPNEPPSIAPPQTVDDKGPRAPTHTGFWMQLEEASSRNGPIRCYEVVVFQLEFDAETNSLIRYTDEDPDDVFPVADVVDYGTANGKPGTAYVAVKLNGNDFKEYVQVGSESRTSCQGSDESSRKRRDTVVFDDSVYNGELEPETVYQAFVRVYVDNPNGGEPYYKSSPFIEPVRTMSAPPTAAIAAISVVVIILIIAIIILTVLLVRRMKKRNERGKGSNKSGMRMRSFSQMGKMNNGFNVQAEETVHSYPAIPNESLPQVYAEKHANDNALFKEEYDDLPRSSRPVTVEASNKPENKPKNRYINIHAYDQSRVKLSILDDDEDTDYINACYVDGYKTSDKFIAAQGPKEDTVDDFWRMVWEKKTLTIVMVTKCSENGREKCAQYWPDSGTEEYGEIEVTFEEVTALADYHIRIFSVCHLSDENEKRKITQLHYTSWPDFGVPGSPIGMLNFIKRARVINPARAGPMVVHCSAGVGRTGTFIVLDAMMDMMAAEGKADVFGFVSKIRGQRNHLVQADVQYVFIHQALAEHHLYGNTEIDVGNLLIHWQKLSKKVPNSDVTGLEDEYNKLINTAVENVVIAEANEDANRSKNRVANTVPYEANRFKLIRLIGKEHSDYVNASSIDGYRQKGAYIAAQGPLPNTLEDFWRLIWESRTGSIVMLTNLVERGQPKCELYWPQEEKEDEDEEQPTMYGNFAVIKKKEEDYTAYTIQEFFVTDTKGGETRTIRHFHYTEWPEVGAPERGTGLIEMMGQIQKQQQQTGNKPILVHCSTGGGRTGVFCVLSTVIERIKAEGIVDIFQTYKVLRQQRPNIIQSIDQYHFVYRAVLDYLDSFDSYDNFK